MSFGGASHRDVGWSSMRAKIEWSVLGRILISVVVAGVVFLVLVVNLPDSQLRSYLMERVSPFILATGLDQNWGVYSNVRGISFYVDGRIEYADGSVEVAGIPSRSGIGTFADYRWQKYEEQLRLDDNRRLWAPYAQFLADRARAAGRNPVRVSLVRRWAETLPPGPGPESGPWQEFTFFVFPVGEHQ
jgi:hypothetical protein